MSSDEGIDAAREVRKRHPGTGVVILSQYDDPEYAVALLAEGSAGYGYLLKQHVADGDQLARAVRAVATGGTSLDSVIVDALMNPVTDDSIGAGDEQLLRMVAEGLPVKAIALARRITPEAASVLSSLTGFIRASTITGSSEVPPVATDRTARASWSPSATCCFSR